MNLFELFVKIGAKDEASGTISKITSGLGKGLATAAKIGTAAVGAAAAGITALTKAAVDNYAEYEQLVGGAELMFGKAYDTVVKNAQDAYKTVQMSQNEYLQQVNGFATGLKTAFGGNEQAAAELAHNIVQAEADIIAATGNTAENVQNAFNGIMKSNFTMLDNLQIGITPTKEGFQEVIDKVNEWNKTNGEATNYQMGNLADMQSALVDYIDMVGMSGYAQREASETITGSLSSMKAAWTNLVTGLADGNADIGQLVDNLVTTIVGDGTENNLGVLGNILPAVEKALLGAGKLIKGAVPILVEMLPGLLEQILPVLISAATDLVRSVVAVLPQIVQLVIDILPELLDFVVDALIDNAPMLIVAAVELVLALAAGLIDAIPRLIQAIPTIIKETVDGFKKSENIKKFMDVGKNIIDGIKSGIKNAWNNLVSWFKGLFGNLIDIAKKILGIASPSKVFKKIGGFTAEGFGAGFEDEFAHVKDDMEDALNFDDASVGINASIRKVGAGATGGAFGGTSIGNININIDGAKYSDEQSLASAIALEIQNMTDRRAAVYA